MYKYMHFYIVLCCLATFVWSNQTTMTTTSTTTTTTHQVQLKRDDFNKIKSSDSQHLNVIVDMLKEEQARSCIHGSNPRLLDICTSLANRKSHSLLRDIESTTLADIENSIINYTVVNKLKKACFMGDWCLSESFYTLDTKTNKFVMNLARNFDPKLYCQYASCYAEIKNYINDCVKSEVSRSALGLAAHMCHFNGDSNQHFCSEQILRLVHNAAAMFTASSTVSHKTNICEEEVMKGRCAGGCKKLASSMIEIESCCSNSADLKSFKSLYWYYTYDKEIEQYCNLPKSLCLFDGKYHIKVSRDILIFSVIASVIITAIVFLLSYVFCCRRSHSILPDMYEYSQLSINEEDQGKLDDEVRVHRGDKVIFDNETKSLIYDFNNNNQNLDEFVNKPDVDIRGLIN